QVSCAKLMKLIRLISRAEPLICPNYRLSACSDSSLIRPRRDGTRPIDRRIDTDGKTDKIGSAADACFRVDGLELRAHGVFLRTAQVGDLSRGQTIDHGADNGCLGWRKLEQPSQSVRRNRSRIFGVDDEPHSACETPLQ